MNKKYQIFVSSTYADLREERRRVIQTLMEMDCIPSGMELFPAADEEQFEFIKRVIDDCDYYILIIGGRYGSTTSEGISFTEMEYEYAISKNLKVIALLHEQPDEIPVGKTDKDVELAQRLTAFRAKVQKGRLVKYWKSADELPGIVSLSLSKTIKTYPATGWVRGDAAASSAVLEEINELRKNNAELQSALNSAVSAQVYRFNDLAGLDFEFEVSGTFYASFGGSRVRWSTRSTFGEIFALIGPHLLEKRIDSSVKNKLAEAILESQGQTVYSATVEDHQFQTIKIQFQALGLVELKSSSSTKGRGSLVWSLTAEGMKTMFEKRVVRSQD